MSHDRPIERERWWRQLPVMSLYAILGLLVGIIGSFTHRSRFAVGDVIVWYGIIIALTCVLAFAIGLRRYTRSRAVGVAFAIGVVAGIVFIAIGYSNSVVIVGDLVGMVWLLAAPMLVFGVAFWPYLPPKEDARSSPPAHPDVARSAPQAMAHPTSPQAMAPPIAPGGDLPEPVAEPFSARGYPGEQPVPAPFPPEEPKQ